MNTEQNQSHQEKQINQAAPAAQASAGADHGIMARLRHRSQVGQVLRTLRKFERALGNVCSRPDAPAFDISDEVRDDPRTRAAAVRTLMRCCEEGQYWHLPSLAASFQLSRESVHELAYGCMLAQVRRNHLPWVGQALNSEYLSDADFKTALSTAVDEMLEQGKFAQAVSLHHDMVFHTRRSAPPLELTDARRAKVREGLLAALNEGSADIAEKAREVFSLDDLPQDPAVQAALGRCLGTVMRGGSSYLYRGLVGAYPVSDEIAGSKEVQASVLSMVAARVANGEIDAAKDVVRRFQPARDRLDRAILKGLARYIRQGRDSHTYITEMAKELQLTHEAVISPLAQLIATHALARQLSLEHARSAGREWKSIHEFFLLPKERLEQAVFTAIGRILGERPWELYWNGWGRGRKFYYDLGNPVDTGMELGDRVRYLPRYAQELIDRFSIKDLTHFCEFAKLNSWYIRHLARNPNREPRITRDMLPAIRGAHLNLLDAEQMLEAGVDVADLAGRKDYAALWTGMKQHCTQWSNAKSACRTMEEAFSRLGHEGTLAFMDQPDQGRDELMRGLKLLNRLSAISPWTPAEFSERLVLPLLADPKEYRKRGEQHAQSSRGFFIRALDLAGLPEVIRALEHPEKAGSARPALESLRLHYTGPKDVLGSWRSFMRFVTRYRATCNRYFLQGAPSISIYERNGLAPDGSPLED